MPRFDLKKLLANRANPNLLLTPLVDRYLLTSDLAEFTDEELDLARELLSRWQQTRSIEYHSPSSSNVCLRQQMLTFFGNKGEEVDDPFLKAIFDDGNWRHLRWHLIFRRMGRAGLLRVVSIEQRIINRAWWQGGTPDDVLDIRDRDGQIVRVVVDIKGANSDKFRWVQQNNQPVDGHEWQLHSYMRALRLGRGILWYDNKNNQEYHEVPVYRDRAIIAELARRSRILKQSRLTGTLPEHDSRCSMSRGSPDPKDLIFRRCRQRFNCMRFTKQGY